MYMFAYKSPSVFPVFQVLHVIFFLKEMGTQIRIA